MVLRVSSTVAPVPASASAQRPGVGGHAGHPAEQVERGPLGGQQRPGRAGHRRQHVAAGHPRRRRPASHLDVRPRRRRRQRRTRPRPRPARPPRRRPGRPGRPCRSARPGWSPRWSRRPRPGRRDPRRARSRTMPRHRGRVEPAGPQRVRRGLPLIAVASHASVERPVRRRCRPAGGPATRRSAVREVLPPVAAAGLLARGSRPRPARCATVTRFVASQVGRCAARPACRAELGQRGGGLGQRRRPSAARPAPRVIARCNGSPDRGRHHPARAARPGDRRRTAARQAGGDVVGDPAGEDQPLQQRVARPAGWRRARRCRRPRRRRTGRGSRSGRAGRCGRRRWRSGRPARPGSGRSPGRRRPPGRTR